LSASRSGVREIFSCSASLTSSRKTPGATRREDELAQLRGDLVMQGVVDQAHGWLSVISCNYG
jgi:hypothetical protein